MEHKYSIYDVAHWFLTRESMTPKKLQKLCYYAQAWSNALFDSPLISDTLFEAWAHGPVSSELYSEYKEYRWNPIEKIDELNVEFDERSADLLESVWLTYGDKSANELEALTHVEQPWKSARSRAGVYEGQRCNEAITNEDMKNYYRSIYIGD